MIYKGLKTKLIYKSFKECRGNSVTSAKIFYHLQSGDVFSIFFKDEVAGSVSSEGRGARFVLGREEDLNDSFEKEPIAKETVSGNFRPKLAVR